MQAPCFSAVKYFLTLYVNSNILTVSQDPFVCSRHQVEEQLQWE